MKSHSDSTPLLAVIVMALLGSGCAWESTAVLISPSGIVAFVGTTWVATEVDGIAANAGAPVDLAFETDRRVHGSSGCNRYMAELNPTEPKFRMGHVVGTRMACEPPLMEQERRFVGALGSTTTFLAEGDTMQFRDRTGRILIRFRRVNAAGSR